MIITYRWSAHSESIPMDTDGFVPNLSGPVLVTMGDPASRDGIPDHCPRFTLPIKVLVLALDPELVVLDAARKVSLRLNLTGAIQVRSLSAMGDEERTWALCPAMEETPMENPPMTELQMGAHQLHEIFTAFLDAGFTESQALYLIKEEH